MHLVQTDVERLPSDEFVLTAAGTWLGRLTAADFAVVGAASRTFPRRRWRTCTTLEAGPGASTVLARAAERRRR